jgi:hypothetical protein
LDNFEEQIRHSSDVGCRIKTVFNDQGRSMVEIPDELWAEATSMDYIEGIPMLMKRK